MIQRLSIICILIVAAANVSAETPSPPLFDSHDVLELTMPVNFDNLCRPREQPDCDYTPTVLEYLDTDGNQKSLNISIRRRDGWRAMQTNCQVPTIFVRFSQ